MIGCYYSAQTSAIAILFLSFFFILGLGKAVKAANSSSLPYQIDAMMNLAQVEPRDLVYDLGSGMGDVLRAAIKRGATAVGIEKHPFFAKESRQTGAHVIEADFFTVDLSPATVITLYLSDTINLLLMPKLKKELRHGARVVSNGYGMGDWKPDKCVSYRNPEWLICLWVIR